MTVSQTTIGNVERKEEEGWEERKKIHFGLTGFAVSKASPGREALSRACYGQV